MSNDAQALAGVRVLEATNYIAGPVAGRILSDLGAEVVKLELPPNGDYGRGRMPKVTSKARFSPIHAYYNRGKASVCIDFKRPEGAAIVRQLIPRFDVFLENLTPGLLAKYGLGYDDLKAIHPRLIMCSVSGFGQTGPMSKLPATDAIAQSISGVTSLTGNPDGMPVFSGIYMADGNAGVNAFGAISAALYYREKSGRGQYIDLCLSECIFNLHDNTLSEYLAGDKAADAPKPFGSHRNGPTPHGYYKTEDGYFIMVVLDHYWDLFLKVAGMPELKGDPRFATLRLRSQNRYILAEKVQEWVTKNFKKREDAIKFIRDAGLIAAPVLSVPEAINHPQINSRDILQPVELPGTGLMMLPRTPYHMSETPTKIGPRVALLGEDNRAVLSRDLGLGDDRIRELTAQGVLAQDPVLNGQQEG
ncbi:MAG TPA: CaiB/BaiF CoA-transferase family protein [Candidatus Binataceae bacterium]|jgi:CoA:oxalate CoA-transferase|nr:CaiB/BaiF CoA-transferase family protein [Candidatus Binataceae bacterium]